MKKISYTEEKNASIVLKRQRQQSRRQQTDDIFWKHVL